ncbi:MAG: helix-hairpin-helix domain-containing protein [Planctomycetota bacterium]|nr:helix-hairpin-helix domain-containing protein [Planctomycetota bacterium]
MSAEERQSPPLSPAARWVAAGVLGVLGVLGVSRGLVGSPPSLLRGGPVAAVSDGGDAGSSVGTTNSLHGAGASRSETAATAQQSMGSGGVSRKIDINTATLAELDILPRIGPTLAARIIADREANGPFGSLDDLDRVPGIGPKTVAKLVPYAAAE